VARLRLAGLVLVLTVLAAGCRGGMAGRAPPPHPTDFVGWLAIVVCMVGGWWLLLKILRG
jgi:hypothetical protein